MHLGKEFIMDFLNALKNEANYTTTENGALTYRSTMSNCLDLFATIGALRDRSGYDICQMFHKAYIEDKDLAMKILFFARDIRGGLGERKTFRTILRFLADTETESVIKNIPYIQEYGRYDDLLVLLDTRAENAVLRYIDDVLDKDLMALEDFFVKEANVSLLAKWLPSINTSNKEAVENARKIAKYLGWSEKTYRQILSKLRKQIKIIENNLREKDYTFDYEKQPSKALFKYRKAFIRNDNERYMEFISKAEENPSVLKTGSLYPYDIIRPIIKRKWEAYYRTYHPFSETDIKVMDATWRALEDFTGCENAIVVRDGSGSMYGSGNPAPIEVSTSLAIYFAERNKGFFKNHFITFSSNPALIKLEGDNIVDKVNYCIDFDDPTNTDIQKVYQLILDTAVKNNLKQEDLPEKIYIISDMEFDRCSNAGVTNFANAKSEFEEVGYKLPQIVFWNVQSRNDQQPVTMNEQGVALVSGCSPRIFDMLKKDILDPYQFMMSTINSERYEVIKA